MQDPKEPKEPEQSKDPYTGYSTAALQVAVCGEVTGEYIPRQTRNALIRAAKGFEARVQERLRIMTVTKQSGSETYYSLKGVRPELYDWVLVIKTGGEKSKLGLVVHVSHEWVLVWVEYVFMKFHFEPGLRRYKNHAIKWILG